VTGEPHPPEPVWNATQLSAAAVWLVGIVVAFAAEHDVVLTEAVTGPLTDALQVGIVAATGAVGSLWAGWWARRRVTPTAAPHTDDGTPLIPRPRKPVEPPTDPIPLPREGLDPDAGGPVNIEALRREYGLET
jgi:hypothetical protein